MGDRFYVKPLRLNDGTRVFGIFDSQTDKRWLYTLSTLPVADAICNHINSETAQAGHNMEQDNELS